MKDFLDCRECDHGRHECGECEGTGEEYYNGGSDHRDCEYCNGTGYVKCYSCNGTGFRDSIWKNGVKKIDIQKDENGEPIYDIQSFFEDTKSFQLIMSPSGQVHGANTSYVGVFSDKRSAIEFSKDLPKIIKRGNDDIRKKVTELLGILSHEPSEDLSDIMNVFSKVSNNKLLPESPVGTENFYNKFFYKPINKI